MSEPCYPNIENPLADALEAITGTEPPAYTMRLHHSAQLPDDQIEALQDWCSENAGPHWSTGIGVLEAAEHIVECAVANANIARADDESYRKTGARFEHARGMSAKELAESVGNRWAGTMAELAKYDTASLAKQTATHHAVTLQRIAEAMRRDGPAHHTLSEIAAIFEEREPGIWTKQQSTEKGSAR